MRKRTAIIILILVSSGGLFSCKKINSDYVGGPCAYADDAVTITVKKITARNENKNSFGNSKPIIVEYELKFDGGIETGRVQPDETAITPEEAKAKDIKIGKQFHASVTRLVSGTCNPQPIYPRFQEWK